jgi:hypothetical protein
MSAPITPEEAIMALEARLPKHTIFVDRKAASYSQLNGKRHFEVAHTISIVPGLSIKDCDQWRGGPLDEVMRNVLRNLDAYFVS